MIHIAGVAHIIVMAQVMIHIVADLVVHLMT